MSSRIADMPPRRAALIAGFAYVVLIVVFVFSDVIVRAGLTDPDDAAATARDIADSEVLFRAGVAGSIIVFIADAVVAWGLYVFFRRTSRELSLIAAWFRLVYVAIVVPSLVNLLVASRLADGTGYPAAIPQGQRDSQVMQSLDTYSYGYYVALVFFGVHLLILGYVMVRSDYAPRVLGRLVSVSGLGYVVANLARVIIPHPEDHNGVILALLFVVSAPGEFGLVGWLLWKGGKRLRAGGAPAESVSPVAAG